MGVDPSSASSAARARTGVGAMPRNEIAERCTAPASFELDRGDHPGEGEVAAAAGDLLDREAGTDPATPGSAPRVRISSSPIVVVQVPTKNSAAGTRRMPAGPGDLELGVERERHRGQLGRGVGVGDRAADGAPVADLEVADEGDGLGEQRHGLAAPASSCSTALWRVIDLTVSVPFVRSTPRRSSTRLRSTMCSKRVSRSASIGTRLWPPASTLASSPCSASNAVTSASDSGAWYSNGAGFIGNSRDGWAREPTAAGRPDPRRSEDAGAGRVRSMADAELPPAIPAATVVLLRDGVDGLETLMLRRNSKLAFAGGAWVFPGGRIDPEDYPGGAARPTTGAVLAAARTAAAREAMEEAGADRRPRRPRLVRALDTAGRGSQHGASPRGSSSPARPRAP